MRRLPPLDPAALSGGRTALYDKIMSGPRGRVGGPMEAMVLCPAAGDPLQELGARLRFGGVLPGKLRSIATSMKPWCTAPSPPTRPARSKQKRTGSP